ncbi:MAG: ABC transporter ATP-binding protein [Candidatus Hadarchaeum sp.]|uniref:ABC transporter ATP-binding protein n=1 Tax=Candidatus Hadarchaeum sp. TaxID=2883567 RepID=UPI003D103855
MLTIRGLNAGYGKFQVLFDVNAEVKKGKILTIVGPNGSGKSTLIKTVMGMTKVYSGKITFKNDDITGLSTHLVTKRGISYLPQTGNVFSNLTVEENLMLAGYTLSKEDTKKRISETIEEFPIVKKYLRKKCGFLSGGERQMVAMAMAMIRKPEMILFDEPVASLSPKAANEVMKKILELNKRGITVVLIEQAAKKALQIADDALLMTSGKVTYQGSAKNLLAHPELGKVYLGIKSGS